MTTCATCSHKQVIHSFIPISAVGLAVLMSQLDPLGLQFTKCFLLDICIYCNLQSWKCILQPFFLCNFINQAILIYNPYIYHSTHHWKCFLNSKSHMAPSYTPLLSFLFCSLLCLYVFADIFVFKSTYVCLMRPHMFSFAICSLSPSSHFTSQHANPQNHTCTLFYRPAPVSQWPHWTKSYFLYAIFFLLYITTLKQTYPFDYLFPSTWLRVPIRSSKIANRAKLTTSKLSIRLVLCFRFQALGWIMDVVISWLCSTTYWHT